MSISPMVSRAKIDITGKIWKEIVVDVDYLSRTMKKYQINKEEFYRKDFSKLPEKEKDKAENSFDKINEVFEKYNGEQGITGDIIIRQRIEDKIWKNE